MKYIYCNILLLLCFCLSKNTGIAQGLATGNTFRNISINKLLNTSNPASFDAIHFALNCGAKSCPPIAFYNDEVLEEQLELATKAYLTSETEYDSSANIIHLPKLMSWFRADFGGVKGMLDILKKYGIIQPVSKPKIKFKDYDWTLQLSNYKTENQ